MKDDMVTKLDNLSTAAGTRYLIVDLEATCWETAQPAPNEIIEIGAVAWEAGRGRLDEFQTFVRPKVCSTLSDFCTALTTIRQEDVDSAPPFAQAYEAFLAWASRHEPWTLASWGNYDMNQIEKDCGLHGIQPRVACRVNLKEIFARMMNVRKCGTKSALDKLGIELKGTHHRGIDDARNIARILEMMMQRAAT